MTRTFGARAALASALALAVFPSFVAVSRDNNLDALLILLMVLACGAALRAVESGRWRALLGCAVLVGLAFNTKTLAAYLIVPGIALAYALCAPGSPRRRALQLLAAGALVGRGVVRLDRLRRTHPRHAATLRRRLAEQHRAWPDLRVQRPRARRRRGRRAGGGSGGSPASARARARRGTSNTPAPPPRSRWQRTRSTGPRLLHRCLCPTARLATRWPSEEPPDRCACSMRTSAIRAAGCCRSPCSGSWPSRSL